MSERRARWTNAAVLDALTAFAGQHGCAPTHADLDPARARRAGQPWRAERFRAGDWPSLKVVRARFGTLNAALRAAGLTPLHPSPRRTRGHLGDGEVVLTAIRRWTHRYGEPPVNADWDPSRARRLGQEWRAVRFAAGDWPTLATVRHHFGSLGAAIAAAGLQRPPRGEALAAARLRRASNAVVAASDELLPLRSALQEALRARAAEDDEALRAGLRSVAASALRGAELVDRA